MYYKNSQRRNPSNFSVCLLEVDDFIHGLRTPNEGINQRNLIIWADVADKICFGRNYKFGIGI